MLRRGALFRLAAASPIEGFKSDIASRKESALSLGEIPAAHGCCISAQDTGRDTVLKVLRHVLDLLDEIGV